MIVEVEIVVVASVVKPNTLNVPSTVVEASDTVPVAYRLPVEIAVDEVLASDVRPPTVKLEDIVVVPAVREFIVA